MKPGIQPQATMVIALSLDTDDNNDGIEISGSALRRKTIEEGQGGNLKEKLTLKEAYQEFGLKLKLKRKTMRLRSTKRIYRGTLKTKWKGYRTTVSVA